MKVVVVVSPVRSSTSITFKLLILVVIFVLLFVLLILFELLLLFELKMLVLLFELKIFESKFVLSGGGELGEKLSGEVEEVEEGEETPFPKANCCRNPPNRL